MSKLCKSLLPAALLAWSLPSSADLSYSQSITVEGGGGLAMFSSEGKLITHIAGDRSRSESQMKMKSGLMSMAAGSGNTGSIIRLDKELTWNLLPDKQQYSEVTFAEARRQFEEAKKSLEQSGGSALPVSEEGCQWSDGDIDVEKSGDKEKIAGISARKHVIRMRQSCTDPNTQKTCDMTWVMETWLARKVPAENEVLKFQQAYLEAMGLGDTARHIQGPGHAMVSMFGEGWEEVADELGKIKGYPLRTVMQMGMGGEQCTTESGQPIAMDGMWADASTAAYNAALDQAGYEAGSAVGRSVAESMGGSIGGNIGGAAVGAAAGELIGGFTGMFKKKKEAKPAQPVEAPSEAGRQITVFRITTEVTDWSEISIPAERFEVPAAWKRI